MVRRLVIVALFILLFVRGYAQAGWIQPPVNPHCYIEHFCWPVVKSGQKVLLHFDEVDHPMVVYINGKIAAFHSGGFGPFNLDITDRVKPGENEIIIPETGAEDRDGRPITPPLTGRVAGQLGGM
jgi:beta-galactosidase/beta-glucuronidase